MVKTKDELAMQYYGMKYDYLCSDRKIAIDGIFITLGNKKEMQNDIKMKHLSISVSRCEDCPFYHIDYNDCSSDEVVCKHPDMKTYVLARDSSLPNGVIIHRDCPLKDEAKTKEEIFVEHIQNHLKEDKYKDTEPKGKVICKICKKDIDEIYEAEKK
jgi:hypothetical protein